MAPFNDNVLGLMRVMCGTRVTLLSFGTKEYFIFSIISREGSHAMVSFLNRMYLFSLSIVVEKEGNVLPVPEFVRRDGPPWIPDHVVICLHQSGVLVSKRRQTTANVVFRFCDQV